MDEIIRAANGQVVINKMTTRRYNSEKKQYYVLVDFQLIRIELLEINLIGMTLLPIQINREAELELRRTQVRNGVVCRS